MGIEELLLHMAWKEGYEEGLEKGFEKVRKERAAKELEEKKVFAIKLKNLGLPVSDIASALRLSTQQVEALTRNT